MLIKNHAPWWVQSHKLKTTIAFDKVMYSRDIQYIYLKKSCIHTTYHKSRHYLTLMTDKRVNQTEVAAAKQQLKYTKVI